MLQEALTDAQTYLKGAEEIAAAAEETTRPGGSPEIDTGAVQSVFGDRAMAAR